MSTIQVVPAVKMPPPAQRYRRKPRTGLIVGLIIGAVILITIIVVVIVIIIRRRNKNNGGGGNPLPGTTCADDTDCATGVCNFTTGVCVACRDDTQCTTTDKPRCLPTNGVCVACIDTSDCTAPRTCDKNQCCENTAPIITSVSNTVSGNSSITVNYDYFQPTFNAKVVVKLLTVNEKSATGGACDDYPKKSCTSTAQCLTGAECDATKCVVPGCLEFPVTGSFTILESNIGGVNLYPGVTYKLKMKIVYSCGADSDKSTPYTPITNVTMDNCPSTPAYTFMGVYGNNATYAGIDLIITTAGVTNSSPNFQIQLLITDDPLLTEPNEMLVVPLTTQTSPADPSRKSVTIPFDNITPGVDYYFRMSRNGSIGSCRGAPSFLLQGQILTIPPYTNTVVNYPLV